MCCSVLVDGSTSTAVSVTLGVLQCVAMRCSVLVHGSTSMAVSVTLVVLQYVAVCCNALQCVAVC